MLVRWPVGVFARAIPYIAWGIWLLVTCSIVGAASRTVVLTAEQETALLAATEQANERLGCTMTSCGGKLALDGTPLVPVTADQALAQIVAAEMANSLRNLDATIAPVLENLRALAIDADTTLLARVLATVRSQATRDRIQQRLAP